MGTHKRSMTRIADAAIAIQFLLVAVGSDAAHIALAGAADLPIGTVPDTPEAGDEVAVNLLGATDETREMVASEAISAGEQVFAGAGGKITDLPAVAGTYWCVGTALEDAAADGDEIEVDPSSPYPVTVA